MSANTCSTACPLQRLDLAISSGARQHTTWVAVHGPPTAAQLVAQRVPAVLQCMLYQLPPAEAVPHHKLSATGAAAAVNHDTPQLLSTMAHRALC